MFLLFDFITRAQLKINYLYHVFRLCQNLLLHIRLHNLFQQKYRCATSMITDGTMNSCDSSGFSSSSESSSPNLRLFTV